MHNAIETRAVLEQVVNTSKNTEDTEREDPDADNGDDGCVTIEEPTEEGEKCSKDVD